MTTAPDIEAQDGTAESTDESLGTQSEVETLGPCKLKVKAEVSLEKVTELLDLF